MKNSSVIRVRRVYGDRKTIDQTTKRNLDLSSLSFNIIQGKIMRSSNPDN